VSTNKMGLGQHRGDGQPAINSGQRTRRDPAADVGQGSGGEEHSQDHGVPGSDADSLINRTHYDPPRTAGEARGTRRR